MHRLKPLTWHLRRLARRAGRWLSSSLAVGFFLGLLASVVTERLKVFLADLDLATVELTATQPVAAEFGVFQVWRNEALVEQLRLRDGNHGTLRISVSPGVYEFRLQVLTKQFSLARKQLSRGAMTHLTDSTLPVPEFFPDDEFVAIRAGQFRQGSVQFSNSAPPHDVVLSSFSIRAIPVTACEYAVYLAAKQNARVDEIGACSGNDAFKPAVYMSWHDAREFCQWLSMRKAKVYRLPTEAEYERAMRIAPGDRRYPWGNQEFDPEKTGVPLANYAGAWPYQSTPERTGVHSFPSILGLYDIAGNVWEWINDWYEPRYYETLHPGEANPSGPRTSSLHQVVVRGGSFADPLYKLSCAFRGGVDPEIGYYNVGFRLVKE